MAAREGEITGHYGVKEATLGKNFGWVPAHAIVECGCGLPELRRRTRGGGPGDEVLHPWYPEHEAWILCRESPRSTRSGWSKRRPSIRIRPW